MNMFFWDKNTLISGKTCKSLLQDDYSNREQDREQDGEQDKEQDEIKVIGSKTLIQLIEFCKKPRTRAELQEYCELMGRRNFSTKYLTPLIEKGIIKITLPDKPTSKNQKYYSA